jgi:hypothetical protein
MKGRKAVRFGSQEALDAGFLRRLATGVEHDQRGEGRPVGFLEEGDQADRRVTKDRDHRRACPVEEGRPCRRLGIRETHGASLAA